MISSALTFQKMLQIGVLITSLLAQVSFARAWEADVHYGLTRWLAKQAGYSDERAKWIAEGNQGVDSSSITDPVHGTIASACTATDKTGSGEVHDHHFPSKNGVPDTPKERVVRPGLVQRAGRVDPAPPLSDRESTFTDLGKFLHALQDTWSHQGVPDFPDPPCGSQVGWGHAFARGGWACHLADLTYRWRDDAKSAAKATYDELVSQTSGTARPWNDLIPALDEFIAGQSKWDKDRWFRAQGFASADLGFLQEISLPDCTDGSPCPGSYPFKYLIEKWSRNYPALVVSGRLLSLSIFPRALSDLPEDFKQVFVGFAAGLVAGTKSVKADAVDTVLSRIALARALHVSDACPNLLKELDDTQTTPAAISEGWAAYQPLELCEAAFQASQAGSGTISCEAAATALRNMKIRRYGPDVRELAPAAQAQGLPLFAFENSLVFDNRTESYSVFVRFIHLPSNSLMLTARRISGVAKIIGKIWSPDQ